MTFSRLFQSFRHAFRGVAVAFEQELSFRLQLVAGLVVLVAAWVFKVRPSEWIVLIFLVGAVLVLELINSVFERLADAFKPRLHPMVRDVKDLMAATVLFVAATAAVIGTLIFLPYVQASL